MKKQLLLKPLLTLALVMICGSAWAGEKTLTFDLSSNPGSWPTANSTTLTNYTYTLNDVDYSFGLKNVKCNSGYLMLTATAELGLPAIEGYKLTKVVAKNTGSCSTSVNVGVSSSSSSASYLSGGEAQKWTTTSSTYTYNLSSTEKNTVYYLYVTNKNAQIVSLELTYDDGEAPTKVLQSISVSGTPAELVVGEEFSHEGITVMANWDSGDPTDVTEKSSYTGYDMSVAGEQTVTVSYTSGDITKTATYVVNIKAGIPPTAYTLVTDATTLKAGDIIVFGCSSYNKVIGAFSTDKSLLLDMPATFSDNKLLAKGANEIALGGSTGAWTFTTAEGLIGATNAKVLSTTNKDRITTWTISIDEEGKATVASTHNTNPDWGTIQYNPNNGNGRFLNYTSVQTAIQIYRLEQNVSITAAKYATLCLPFNFTVPEGVTAYTAEVNDEQDLVNITAIAEDAVIPANMGIIISGEAGTYTFTGSAATPSSLGDNDLVGVTEDTELTGGYILALDDDGTTIKFFQIDPDDNELGAYKAYLNYTGSANALGIRVNDATGIRTIEAQAVNQYFDLMGRKVQNPERGIYILNGKKVYVK